MHCICLLDANQLTVGQGLFSTVQLSTRSTHQTRTKNWWPNRYFGINDLFIGNSLKYSCCCAQELIFPSSRHAATVHQHAVVLASHHTEGCILMTYQTRIMLTVTRTIESFCWMSGLFRIHNNELFWQVSLNSCTGWERIEYAHI